MRCIIRVLLCIFLFSGLVWGQATGQISGTVRDETSAVIPGVEVKVTQTATGCDANSSLKRAGRLCLRQSAAGTLHVGVVAAGL